MPQYAFTQKTVKYLGEPNIRLVIYLILCCSQEQRNINSVRTLETPKGGIGDINSVAADGSAQRFSIILINTCHYLLKLVVSAKVVSQYLKCLIYCVVIILRPDLNKAT